MASVCRWYYRSPKGMRWRPESAPKISIRIGKLKRTRQVPMGQLFCVEGKPGKQPMPRTVFGAPISYRRAVKLWGETHMSYLRRTLRVQHRWLKVDGKRRKVAYREAQIGTPAQVAAAAVAGPKEPLPIPPVQSESGAEFHARMEAAKAAKAAKADTMTQSELDAIIKEAGPARGKKGKRQIDPSKAQEAHQSKAAREARIIADLKRHPGQHKAIAGMYGVPESYVERLAA